MRKHILSKYSNTLNVNVYKENLGKKTIETANLETSDSDEFYLIDQTFETKKIEISDPDELYLIDQTFETRNIEVSDPDEFVLGPSKHTFTIEDSDPDEFAYSVNIMNNDKDFDEILLL